MRDNFSKNIVEKLAKRVNYLCSNPNCGRLTTGPSLESTQSITTIGIAAHITAASPGGPRYNSTMTSVERSSMLNGIWLCGICAKLIDIEPNSHSIALLHEWKNDTEERVRRMFEESINFKQTNSRYSNRLKTESISVLEYIKRLNFFGFKCASNVISKSPFSCFAEFYSYREVESPKLLIFKDNNNYGVLLITDIQFNSSSNITLNDRLFDDINDLTPKRIFVNRNNCNYELNLLSNKKSFKVKPLSSVNNLPENIDVFGFIYAYPNYIYLDIHDLFYEVNFINLVLSLLYKFKNKKNWDVVLCPTYKISSENLMKLKLPVFIKYVWLISAKVEENRFLTIYFFKNEYGIISIVPDINNTVYDSMYLFVQKDKQHLISSGFKSEFLEFLLNSPPP